MPSKLFRLMVAVLSIAAFVAVGCGDDDETTTNDAPATEATAEAPAAEPTEDTGSSPAPANAEQAVEACKSSIDAQPQVSDDIKNDLKEICDKAASGDEVEVKEATREVCTKLIEESVPEGPARDQALETCKTATE